MLLGSKGHLVRPYLDLIVVHLSDIKNMFHMVDIEINLVLSLHHETPHRVMDRYELKKSHKKFISNPFIGCQWSV